MSLLHYKMMFNDYYWNLKHFMIVICFAAALCVHIFKTVYTLFKRVVIVHRKFSIL